ALAGLDQVIGSDGRHGAHPVKRCDRVYEREIERLNVLGRFFIGVLQEVGNRCVCPGCAMRSDANREYRSKAFPDFIRATSPSPQPSPASGKGARFLML